jgi:predicted ATPase
MRVALARHDALLRAVIEAHGGYVFKTVGDAFCAAFGTAPAGVAAQEALAAEDWGDQGPLRARMALNTGAVEERDGDYFGPPLNRAARLMSAGHGGQVLLSQSTHELVRDTPPDGATFVDLGEHRLKDLIRPERVLQVIAPDLASDFPPLASLDVRPHNLPTHPTVLLGRERELTEVRALFEDGARLVTLTGPGGTGKTRLSLQVAAELLDVFEHGVFFVELAPITDPALVPSAIGQVLGVREGGGRPILESVKAYLSGRSLLLVLDNFEQIVAAASVVADLLASSPGLKALVSSREPLQVRGEREYAVSPLALPADGDRISADTLRNSAAVALFEERATAVRGDFAVTDENAAAVAEICRRLDGLPLAIELAADRVRLLTPQVMVKRLEPRLPLLAGGARDLPARHQTLRDTIAWSHDLLDYAECRLVHRLAVFVGGWTLDAAESVCAADGDLDVLEELESLISKSLVKSGDGADGEPRFWMLETIREFALERLEASGEEEPLRRRHLAYFLSLAERAEPELRRSNQLAWLVRLEYEHDNLRAALGWSLLATDRAEEGQRLAGSMYWFWSLYGPLGEGRRWLQQTLALSDATPVSVRAKVLEGTGILAHNQGEYGRAAALQEMALALSRSVGDRFRIARELTSLGVIKEAQGDSLRAAVLLEEGLALSRELGATWNVAMALRNLGRVAVREGDRRRAIALTEESLALSRQLGDTWAIAWALHDLGDMLGRQGDSAQAAVLLEESLTLRRELGDKRGTAWTLNSLARVTQAEGNHERATALYRECLLLANELGEKSRIVNSLDGLARIAEAQGRMERALRLLGAAETLRDTTGASLGPAELDSAERGLQRVPTRAADEASKAAWAAGRAMTLEQAVAYAPGVADPA